MNKILNINTMKRTNRTLKLAEALKKYWNTVPSVTNNNNE